MIRINLSHLCFADDLMIFAKATQSSLQGVKGVLNEFYSFFGLQISHEKSEVFCSRLSYEIKAQLARQFGIHLGRLSVRYLGVPFISRKLREADCKPLVD